MFQWTSGAITIVLISPQRLDGGHRQYQPWPCRTGAGTAISNGTLLQRPQPLLLLTFLSIVTQQCGIKIDSILSMIKEYVNEIPNNLFEMNLFEVELSDSTEKDIIMAKIYWIKTGNRIKKKSRQKIPISFRKLINQLNLDPCMIYKNILFLCKPCRVWKFSTHSSTIYKLIQKIVTNDLKSLTTLGLFS